VRNENGVYVDDSIDTIVLHKRYGLISCSPRIDAGANLVGQD